MKNLAVLQKKPGPIYTQGLKILSRPNPHAKDHIHQLAYRCNTYTSSTKSTMFDNSGFCTKRRSPPCTCQTTRSTADDKIIECFNCFRHHEAKRQAHLSRNYELFPTPECLRDSQVSRCSRSFWTDVNRLEPKVPEKQDGDPFV